jgi:hypothetical protein
MVSRPKLKAPWRDGTTQPVMSPLKIMQRLMAPIPFSQASAAASANGNFAAVNPGRRVPVLGQMVKSVRRTRSFTSEQTERPLSASKANWQWRPGAGSGG